MEGVFNPSGIVIQDEGGVLGTVNTINFVGAGISASVSGDVATITVSGGGGGGSVTINTAVLDLPYSLHSHSITVTDASVSSTSNIIPSLGSQLDTDENSADMVDLLGMSTVPQTGSFIVNLSFLTPIGGQLKINYLVA
jgi:hypothetical protein